MGKAVLTRPASSIRSDLKLMSNKFQLYNRLPNMNLHSRCVKQKDLSLKARNQVLNL